MSTCEHTFDAASYALGTLDAPDREAFEAHLPDCADCRVALAEVSGLPALLAKVPAADVAEGGLPRPSEAMFERLLAAAVRRRREIRRRRLLAGAAAAAVLAVGAAGGTALVEARSQPQVRVVAAGAGAVQARVEVRPAGDRTDLSLQLSGVPALEHCRLVAVDRNGRREVALSWRATYSGTATVDGSTAIAPGQLAWLRVETDTATLVSMAVPER